MKPERRWSRQAVIYRVFSGWHVIRFYSCTFDDGSNIPLTSSFVFRNSSLLLHRLVGDASNLSPGFAEVQHTLFSILISQMHN